MSVDTLTAAQHRGATELPFVEIGGGNKLKVIQVDVAEGLWIVENIFQTGYAVQTHRHTGPVYGYTMSGAWRYQEYDYVNRAGSFLLSRPGRFTPSSASRMTPRCGSRCTGSISIWARTGASKASLTAPVRSRPTTPCARLRVSPDPMCW